MMVRSFRHISTCLRLSSVCAIFLLSSQSVFAEPKFTTKYEYFTVTGTSTEDLWRSIQDVGPKSGFVGIGHAGYTSFKFENSVGVIQRQAKCEIKSINFHLISTVELPKWKDASISDGEMNLYWQALSKDVKRHEDGHVKIAEESVADLDKKIRALRVERSCDTLKRKIRRIISTSERSRNRAQNAFERKEMRGQRKRLSDLIETLRNS